MADYIGAAAMSLFGYILGFYVGYKLKEREKK